MQRLYDFKPGQMAMAHNRYFVTVWAKWEKVGQHQRTWYMVADTESPRPYVDFLSEDFIELLPEVDEAPSRRITFQEVQEAFQGLCVLDAADPYSDFGGAYGMATLFENEDEVGTWSVGRAGSGYPWWLVGNDNLVVADAWAFYGEHHEAPDFNELWAAKARNSPRLQDVVV